MRRDCEPACDALVLSRISTPEYKLYGGTILRLMDIVTRPLPHPGFVGIVEGKSQIKRRISAIAMFKKRPFLPIIALLIILGLVIFLLTDAVVDKNQILFESNRHRDGDRWDIYVMNENGRRVKNLTSNLEYSSYNPVWSPDGNKIAFENRRYISVINADGTGFTQLQLGESPAWSPDGTKIAYSYHDSIYIMNADGTGKTHLIDAYAFDWSPDGTKIACSVAFDIYVMNADGTGKTNLTNHRARDYNPVWSPDGKKIAFLSFRDRDTAIYVMNSDGTGVTRLTDMELSWWDQSFAWSPDGQKIAFRGMGLPEMGLPGEFIYIVNVDGTGLTKLNNSLEGSNPIWSPDGKKIAFVSGWKRNPFNIFVTNVDGTGFTRLRQGSSPTWRPLNINSSNALPFWWEEIEQLPPFTFRSLNFPVQITKQIQG